MERILARLRVSKKMIEYLSCASRGRDQTNPEQKSKMHKYAQKVVVLPRCL
jgi:hypothetical protein